MNIEKENWKDQVLESLQGMQRAEPSPFLFAKIKDRIKGSKEQLIMVQPSAVRLAIASLILLFALNISVIVVSSRAHTSSTDLLTEAGSFTQSFNLYGE